MFPPVYATAERRLYGVNKISLIASIRGFSLLETKPRDQRRQHRADVLKTLVGRADHRVRS